MRILLLLTAVLAAQALYAQKITVKGKLTDSSGSPLPMATILFLNPKDSTLVNFGSTDKEGLFEVKNLNRAEYLFKVTYISQAPLFVKISPKPDDLVIDLGVQKMEPASTMLGEVEIKGERAPVTIKKDTIEFNAGSFKTQPNAVVEDLLKKMPGMEVDNDGTIRAQGETVQRVTVDGKEFFGRDPKLATRNLPADAVDKVQVFDKKSDQAAFTGIDDGQREKTINLELKEEKRNGMFGNATAGYGTPNDRFTGRLSLNRFSKGQQFSIVGTANNVNEQGFSIDDYMTFTGGASAFAGGGGGGARTITVTGGGGGGGGGGMQLGGGQTNGIMQTYGGGLNFNKDIGKKTKFSANYFVNYLVHDIKQETEREYFDETAPIGFYNDVSNQHSTNLNHRLNTIIDHEIDSANSIKWTNGVTLSNTNSLQEGITQTLTFENDPLVTNDRVTRADGTSLSYNSELLYRHKFGKKGRTFSSTLNFSLQNSDRDGTLKGTYTTPEIPDSVYNQRNAQATDNLTYGAALSYTEPLGGRKYLEANYNVRLTKNDVDRAVYDIQDGSETENDRLSSKYNSDYLYQRAGLNFKINRDNSSLTVGGAFQQTLLTGDILKPVAQKTNIDRTFANFLPSLHYNYDFDNNMRLRADYETSMQAPTIQQLQPTIDNSNLPNIYVGNPNLKPSYQHSLRLNFSKFDPVSFVSFFAFINATYTTDAITNSQSINNNGAITTIPVNVDNNMNLSGNVNASIPLSKLFSRFNIGLNARDQKSISVSNETQFDVDQLTLGGSLRYTFTYKEFFDLSLATNLSQQRTNYESGQQDQKYFNKTYTAESNINFLKVYRLSGNLNYMQYQNQSNNSTISIPMLNMSFSRYILKANAGEIKLSVNNLLDRRLGISQSANTLYFERQTMNSLGRYFMLSFTYAINRHLNPMGGGRRGGGGQRMIMIGG
ncbi:MAG: TonB-dependent receptor family protein [Cyclobacteriaceae bacterium]|nr:TonB-dependent receptor family protein [Cyclobacteriaceae bacterium]